MMQPSLLTMWMMHSSTALFRRRDFRDVGPLIIFGPVLTLAGMYLAASSMELAFRLRKQIDRVMDHNLLETNNINEVKHWIEPGLVKL